MTSIGAKQAFFGESNLGIPDFDDPLLTLEAEKKDIVSELSELNPGSSQQSISSLASTIFSGSSTSTSSTSSVLSLQPKKEEETKEQELELNPISDVKVSSDKITMGQGEYIVFHQLSNGETKRISREMYEQVYKILNQYSPSAIVEKGSDKIAEDCANRYESIKAKLKEIDSSLEVVFVPRTLYELIFIRKCIKEDFKHNKDNECCPYMKAMAQSRAPSDLEKEARAKRKCWHLAHFGTAGDANHWGVKEVAYRLNQVMVRIFSPTRVGFTHKEFSTLAEKEIEFLKAYHKKGMSGEIDEIFNSSFPGPSSHFGCESTRGLISRMGIRNDVDAQIIRNAITLDCSEIAKHSFLLYRGSNFKKDSAYNAKDAENPDRPYSLSYGSSLFAGCIYDGGATSFYFMRKHNAYAILVPFHQLRTSPFYYPLTNTVAQLFGHGEVFHARTKAWKDFDVREMVGVQGEHGNIRDHLTCNLTQAEFIAQFIQYKHRAIQLKVLAEDV